MTWNRGRVILSLYDHSGEWSRPYREAGYTVRQVDKVLDGTDIRLMEVPTLTRGQYIHGILAAPPCTVFTLSGNRWERSSGEMLAGLHTAAAVLRFVHACKPKWWALENPVGKLCNYLGPPAYYFDPCDFGDPWTKRTALWGDFTPPEKSPVPANGTYPGFLLGPSPERSLLRSVTPAGFARAFFEANP